MKLSVPLSTASSVTLNDTVSNQPQNADQRDSIALAMRVVPVRYARSAFSSKFEVQKLNPLTACAAQEATTKKVSTV
jgi:hypothetical protein